MTSTVSAQGTELFQATPRKTTWNLQTKRHVIVQKWFQWQRTTIKNVLEITLWMV
jgi:hypothetical protein